MSDESKSGDDGKMRYRLAELFSAAWNNQQVMDDLLSGDQDKIHRRFKEHDIGIDAGVNMHVHQGSETERHLVLPPKVYIDEGGDDPGGKCYGPVCLVLSGPY